MTSINSPYQSLSITKLFPPKTAKMGITKEIIMPVVGLATNQFIPFTENDYVFTYIYLCLQCATLLFWVVLLVAIVRDRHYEDANNLLIMSFALADIVCTSSSFHSCLSNILDHGYARGYIGMHIRST